MIAAVSEVITGVMLVFNLLLRSRVTTNVEIKNITLSYFEFLAILTAN